MRDSHRLKEKYELSLDNRQIVTWLVAALVALGGTFVLGVVVGKKLAADQGAHAPPDLLTAVDQKTTALEHVQRDASLTFQEELTRKTPAAVEAPVRAPEPRKAPEEPKKVEERRELAEAPLRGDAGALVAEAARPAPEPAKVEEPRHEPEKVAARVEEPRHEPRHADPAMAERPKEEAVATRTRDGGSLKDAFARAQKMPEASADGSWTLQLAAYQDKAEADRFAAGLRDKGYAPYLVQAEVAGKGTWYRVRMGRFASRDAASNYLADFKRETSMSAIVTNAK